MNEANNSPTGVLWKYNETRRLIDSNTMMRGETYLTNFTPTVLKRLINAKFLALLSTNKIYIFISKQMYC